MRQEWHRLNQRHALVPSPDYLWPKQRLALCPTLPKQRLALFPTLPSQRLALVPSLPNQGSPPTNMRQATCQQGEKLVDTSNAICLISSRMTTSAKAFYRCNVCNSLSARIYRARGRVAWESQEANT